MKGFEIKNYENSKLPIRPYQFEEFDWFFPTRQNHFLGNIHNGSLLGFDVFIEFFRDGK